MQYLDDGLSDGFDVLFMMPINFYAKCDHFIQYVNAGIHRPLLSRPLVYAIAYSTTPCLTRMHITRSIKDAPDVAIMGEGDLVHAADFGLNADVYVAEHVASILRKGLGDRVSMIATRMHGAMPSWPVTEVCV